MPNNSGRPSINFAELWGQMSPSTWTPSRGVAGVHDENQVQVSETRPISTADLERMASEDTPVNVEEDPTFAIRADDPAWSGVSPADAPYEWDDNGEPVIERPPSDPMVRHESDTHAIGHFRSLVELHNSGANPLGAEEHHNNEVLLRTLTTNAREIWWQNGGRNSRRTLRSLSNRGTAGSRLMREPETGQTFFGNIPETSTMTTVASNFGMRVNYPSIEKHPLIVGTHLAGVEIELENLAIEHPSFRYWTAKNDGSLRNHGMEFVCSHPWGGVDLYNAAVEIDGFLFGNNPDDTWRCSTHVHIDVRDMTAAQVKKMILAYVFFERVLFKCSGWHRYKNNFCVALGFAQGQLEDLGNWWAENDNAFFNNLTTRWDKYTAINFLPMSSFGSIEFRLGEAKWHKGQLIRLTNRFLSLKEVAMANSDMDDEQFLQFLMQTDPSEIIRKGIPKGLTGIQDDIEVGFKLANDILSLAKLRRRSRRLFKPDLEDGSRVVTQPCSELFQNGWQHCVSHLSQRYTNLEFPGLRSMRDESGQNYVWNFAWLFELYSMMRRERLTFEAQWFLPQQNRTQLSSLFDRYIRERRAAEQEEAPVAEQAPAQRRRRAPEPVPTPFDDPDEDEGSDEDSSIAW